MAIEIGRINVGNAGYGNNQLFVNYDIISQDINKNETIIKAYIYLYCPVYISSSNTNAFIGSTGWFDIPDYFSAGTHLLHGETIVINHNEQGIGEFALNYGIRASYLLNGSATTRIERLPTIPRVTYVPPVTAIIGETVTVKINPASSQFTHKAYYLMGDIWVQLGEGIYNEFELTSTDEIYPLITTSQNARGTLYLETYNGTQKLGISTSLLTLKVNEEESKPISTINIIDSNLITSNLTENNKIIILGESTAKITINTKTRKNATLSKIKINDVVYNYETPIQELVSYDYEKIIEIPEVTTSEFLIEIIDSRGLIDSHNITLEKIEYIPLTISAQVQRNTPVDNKIKMELSGNYYNTTIGNTQNTLNISFRYKIQTEDTWSEYIVLTPTIEENTYNSTYVSDAVIDYRYIYDIEILTIDKLNEIVTKSIILEGVPIFWWNKEKITMEKELVVNSNIYDKDKLLGGYITKITDSSTNPLTYVATTDCAIEIEAVLTGWGFAGGNLVLSIGSQGEGVQTISEIRGYTFGLDNIARQINCKSIFKIKKDTIYTFFINTIQGSISGFSNLHWVVKEYKGVINE